MNLYIFPSRPVLTNGYGIAVNSDIKRLTPSTRDIIIWYDAKKTDQFSNDIVLLRPGMMSLSRLINVLQNRVSCELSTDTLCKLDDIDINQIEKVFCGDVVFYRALREIFPNKKIIVRFHNCFARIKDRISLIDAQVNLRMRINLSSFYKLEKEIFQDKNVHKIFISEEDRLYYTSHFGIESDSEVWGFEPDMTKAVANRTDCKKTRLVHFGGMQSHKIDAMNWFIKDVFIPLHKECPHVQFHLYGGGTNSYTDSLNGIYGHGFYDGNDLPDSKEGLFINPDTVGGGVKIKMLDYFEKGGSFISTPYGYEGYPKDLIDNKFYFMIEKDKWLPFLIDYFRN